MRRYGKRMFQSEETANARALRQEQTWHTRGKARRPLWLEHIGTKMFLERRMGGGGGFVGLSGEFAFPASRKLQEDRDCLF